jgi:phosphatidylglycerophosphatase A
MRRLALFICSVGYIGFFPVAPGTIGSAAGLVVYVLFLQSTSLLLQAFVIVTLFALGVIFTRPCEEDLRCTDPGPIVIDEVMGMLIAVAMMPVGWGGMALGFFLFRVFDVFKPFPARQFERLPGGFGVMADDVVAGLYASLVLRGVAQVAPHWVS